MPEDTGESRRREKPIPDAALELLTVMVESKRIIIRHTGINHSSITLNLMALDTMEQEDAKKLAFPVTDSTFDSLYKRGFIAQAARNKVEEVLEKNRHIHGRENHVDKHMGKHGLLAWNEHPWAVTRAGKEYVLENMGRLFEIRKARQQAEENPRYVATVRMAGYVLDRKVVPGVNRLYRVVRETPSRIYIAGEAVAAVDRHSSYDPAVQGHGSNTYIDKTHVKAVDVTPEQFEGMKRATLDFEASVQRVNQQAEDEIAPIRRRQQQRTEQLQAQLEDEMRELMQPSDTAPKP